jgi:hypothetical protein
MMAREDGEYLRVEEVHDMNNEMNEDDIILLVRRRITFKRFKKYK